ncbi:hypothetical protein GGR56DRAFT_688446 [Xylariaceae sp. FL0804]|nr:hypothetical protein GGR56DRAFT_688446 [Xylariaceae sp. FL0804]
MKTRRTARPAVTTKSARIQKSATKTQGIARHEEVPAKSSRVQDPAPKTRRTAREDLRAREELGLDWTAAQRDAYVGALKVVDLHRLPEPYPLDQYYTAGTPTARKQWTAYWDGRPVKDSRYNHGERRDILDMDESRLQYIIPQDESVVFRDADTKELVLVVLRDFMPDETLRGTMVDLCKEIIRHRRNDRREDPGMLVHFGYTCGSRHCPQLQMAARSTRLDTVAKQTHERELNDRAQGMAGLVWNMLRSRLPAEIIADYNDLIRDIDLPRMDMGRDDETFTFEVGGKKVTFRGLEMPPPSGLSAINYARHTHKENNANNWVVALTANAPDDPSKGGNFCLASYGIMMQPASNTVSAWHPSDHHGTTLYEMEEGPERRTGYEVRPDRGFNTGMVFELSRAIRNARKNSKWLDERRRARGLPPAPKTSGGSKQTRYSLRSRTRAA